MARSTGEISTLLPVEGQIARIKTRFGVVQNTNLALVFHVHVDRHRTPDALLWERGVEERTDTEVAGMQKRNNVNHKRFLMTAVVGENVSCGCEITAR